MTLKRDLLTCSRSHKGDAPVAAGVGEGGNGDGGSLSEKHSHSAPYPVVSHLATHTRNKRAHICTCTHMLAVGGAFSTYDGTLPYVCVCVCVCVSE